MATFDGLIDAGESLVGWMRANREWLEAQRILRTSSLHLAVQHPGQTFITTADGLPLGGALHGEGQLNTMKMSNIDKAIAILAATRDGEDLTAHDLRLVEIATAGNLSERGEEYFSSLFERVLSGNYDKSKVYLFDIEHVTRDSEGYVYWKGTHVEHYSHSSREEMKAAAEALAARCQALEAKGFPVNARTAICGLCLEAPTDTPWKEALLRYYTLFKGNGRHVAIFYCLTRADVVVLEQGVSGELHKQYLDSAYDAFHLVQKTGLKGLSPVRDYKAFVEFMEASKLTPEGISAAI